MTPDVLRHPMVRITCAALLVSMIGACGDRSDDGSTTGEAEEDVVDDGGTAEGPPLVVTVSHGRSVEVDDSVYADSGVFRGRRVGRSQGRAILRLGPPGKSMTQVSMRATPQDSLVLVHVDASTNDGSTILLYGAYGSEMAGMSQTASPTIRASVLGMATEEAAKAGWECIWCRGGILACGVEPQCGP